MVKGLEVIEDTILENVRVGRAWLSLAEVRAALEAVGLLDEVSELPDGLHTRLIEQRRPRCRSARPGGVMLARAIVGRPRLLVVDEGLDGLDLDARRRVLETLFDRSAPWTLLIVTHAPEMSPTAATASSRWPTAGPSTRLATANGHDASTWKTG